ncbi:hypothetical protein SAMN05421776_11749 [Nocardia farcinica]|uniref:Uncharacterized protein n=1 Tax=Nocardia farcinica TaxID=37329 RepID=A0A0H5NWE0_NOCFR|nr:hypothetical protein [Nocardia farcinica]PFW99056.1 hypothetical protein CJ469_05656 [Nocardia farcinica]PFX06094.1 hypothetical protein CJ468_04954 [Nocardia farcinica]CRY79802.1 Uncharacterised protein [Nocardia farcinica]CRY79895.1 Uncharacterised protein [Nocardia farcinica]SIT33636.1 hypothetical protein SAMN05421776_11749 [Nocardia farcinica]
MSYPVGPKPDGAWQLGDSGRYGQGIEEDAVLGIVTNGAKTKAIKAQDEHRTNVRERIDNTYSIAQAASGAAGQAVTEAQAAVNAAAAAEATAATAYNAASYWEAEFVAASAAVVLGENELLIGLCQNVPAGLKRKVTDIHVALLSQPNGMTFELKKWNAAGTVNSVVETYTLTANQTRANWQILGGHEVSNRERLYVNVTSVTGSVAPVVLQILVFGVLYDPNIQEPSEVA